MWRLVIKKILSLVLNEQEVDYPPPQKRLVFLHHQGNRYVPTKEAGSISHTYGLKVAAFFTDFQTFLRNKFLDTLIEGRSRDSTISVDLELAEFARSCRLATAARK